MTEASAKRKILSEFATMKSIEQEAHDFYVKASADPLVADPVVLRRLKTIADDERRHVEMVEKIINIVSNCL
jgi:rubrerythrin